MTIARQYTHFSSAEISALFEHAKRVQKTPYFDILLAPAQHPYGRILIVVKRTIAAAPARNRIRRQIKTIFIQQRWFEYPRDIVILIKKDGLELSFARLKELLIPSIEKAHESAE